MIVQADARYLPLTDNSVQCVVTSPPYWGLRDYGITGQIGLEPSVEEYIDTLRVVFAELWRVCRDDAVVWLNLGDSYAGSGHGLYKNGLSMGTDGPKQQTNGGSIGVKAVDVPRGLKPKDLIGIPWRIAFALQADGWYLRSDIIWAKPNPMPESVTDRPTRSHEYLFLLTKSARYYYDADAIAEPIAESSIRRISQPSFDSQNGGAKDYGPGSNRSARQALNNLKSRLKPSGDYGIGSGRNDGNSHPSGGWDHTLIGRNKRDVWTINSEPTPEAHFATFPSKLVEPCVLAGSRIGDVVFDPFLGSGTVGKVAERLGRRWVGTELSWEYIGIAKRRTRQMGLFAHAAK